MADKTQDIVYIEASTANRWKLADFGKRVGDDRFRIETMTQYDFDKTPRLDKALKDRQKPDAIVLQECSVYFPGEMKSYQALYREWIRRIKAAGVRPIIATTVPPAESQGWIEDTKAFIKVRILRQESQYNQVVQFNEWLRALAISEKVDLFDLEALIRKSESNRHMRDEYNAGDGIHLNAEGYRLLDGALHSFLVTRK